MPTISTSIIAWNQADKIADAIASVLWTDEIVVADSNSTDATVEIAERTRGAGGADTIYDIQ